MIPSLNFDAREPAGIHGEIQIRYPGFGKQKKVTRTSKIAVQAKGIETEHATLEKREAKRIGPRQAQKHQVGRCFSPTTRLVGGVNID